MKFEHWGFGKQTMAVVGFILAGVLLFMFLLPQWNVWRQGLSGEASLRKAEHQKQIMVEQARAEADAAKLRAEAIETLGAAAQKYPEYRQQEFIGAFATALEAGTIQQIIYVPTEANLPILEARDR